MSRKKSRDPDIWHCPWLNIVYHFISNMQSPSEHDTNDWIEREWKSEYPAVGVMFPRQIPSLHKSS